MVLVSSLAQTTSSYIALHKIYKNYYYYLHNLFYKMRNNRAKSNVEKADTFLNARKLFLLPTYIISPSEHETTYDYLNKQSKKVKKK